MNSSKFDRAPSLLTERLRLRAATQADLDACHAMWSDPDLRRPPNMPPPTREESWARMLRSTGLWPLLGFGFWLIEEKASGRVVGDIGALVREREMTPPLGDDPELGWSLAPAVHGHGYASEALAAVLAWMDENVRAPRYVCIIDPDNLPSLRLASKFGFRQKAIADIKGVTVIQLERFAA
jgi:RimJ/RimL family protein N-acetyltransferase